jgi:mRNA interferase HigB
MRIVSRNTLSNFWTAHPETEASLRHWFYTTRRAKWMSMQDVRVAFPKAKVLNRERVRFAVHGNNYRMIVSCDFLREAVFIKFLGTHAQYDAIDPFTVSGY